MARWRAHVTTPGESFRLVPPDEGFQANREAPSVVYTSKGRTGRFVCPCPLSRGRFMHTTAFGQSSVVRATVLPAVDFVVGEWRVEPDLSRVSRHGVTAHVRPKLMDLLVYLARNSERTVPHDELLANVWPGQPFIASTALARCIAELRQTLGDHATGSTVIQTIPKRGYRLIAAVGPYLEPDRRPGEPAQACLSPVPRPAIVPPAMPTLMPASLENPRGTPPIRSAAAPADAGALPRGAGAPDDRRPIRRVRACLRGARQLASRLWQSFRARGG